MNRLYRPTYLASLCLAMAVPLWGFGCGNDGRPGTHPVSGTVTLNGAPVEGATVNFHRTDGSQSSVGRTDAQGRYELTTFTSGDGALPGEYHVTVTKYELPPGAVPDDPDPPEEGPDYDADPIVPENMLPASYANAETSELTATVAEGSNTFDFELQE